MSKFSCGDKSVHYYSFTFVSCQWYMGLCQQFAMPQCLWRLTKQSNCLSSPDILGKV